MKEAREESGLDANTFAIFWVLERKKVANAESVAKEISGAFSRFGNFDSNSDELRQLKAAIYKILLPIDIGRSMIELTDEILTSWRK